MRHHLAPVVVGLAAAVAILTSEAAAQPAHESRTLPKLVAGSYSGIEPKVIFFSGDAGNIVVKIRWQRWTQTGAVGDGTSNILGCIPNCAQGKATPVATKVTLSKVRSGHFTKIVETRAGHTYAGYYSRRSWPEGAQ
jgi:hypothetical protein